MRGGYLLEYETGEALLAAIRALRGRGYSRIEAYTPYPLPGLEAALGLRRSPITFIAFLAAVVGAAAAYLIQWYTNAVDYPLNVGGRPAHMPPAFVPITFEMGVLFAALTAFALVFALSGLPRLWSPLFEAEGFERASIDRFFLAVDARDPAALEREAALRELTGLGALRVVHFGEVP